MKKLDIAIVGVLVLLCAGIFTLAGVLSYRAWPGWGLVNEFGPAHAAPAEPESVYWVGDGPDVLTYESRQAGPAVFTLTSNGWTGFTLSDSSGRKIAILGHGEFPDTNMARAVKPLAIGTYYINIEQPTGGSAWGVQIERN